MKLLTQQSILNDNYVFVFSIDTNSISSDDVVLFQKHGTQIVNFGATTGTDYAPDTISVYSSYDPVTSEGVASATDTFHLSDSFTQFPTCFPVRQSFTAIDPSPFVTNTAARLIAYRKYIEAQVYAIVMGLRNAPDTFTGSFITNI